MSEPRRNFDKLLVEVRNIVTRTPALQAFAPVPDDLEFVTREPAREVFANSLQGKLPPAIAPLQALVTATEAVLESAQWRATYTKEELGQDFIDRYGYFELYGPEGHYISHQSRAFLGYWGAGLHYPSHCHLAEEIYCVAAGQALFGVDDADGQVIEAGHTRQHSSNQSHWMTTEDSAVLCLVLWRGPGLAGSATLE